MVLRPGRPHRRPRTVQDLVGPLSQHADRLTFHLLRVVEVDFPVTSVRELGEHLAIHDRVGAGLIWRATLDGDVVGEVRRPGSERDRDDRRGQRGCDLVERSRRRPNDRRSHLCDQRSRGGDIETPTLVVNRCRRHAGFDQLDPPAVHDLVVSRRRHGNGPAEMIGDAQTHAPIIRGYDAAHQAARTTNGAALHGRAAPALVEVQAMPPAPRRSPRRPGRPRGAPLRVRRAPGAAAGGAGVRAGSRHTNATSRAHRRLVRGAASTTVRS